jgi:hypothetical protein
MTILPYSWTFDQSTMAHLMLYNDLVQDYRALFALLDWELLPDTQTACHPAGRPSHPRSAYLKALLLKVREGLPTCTKLRAFLLKQPLLVIELGFHLHLDITQPDGFDVGRSVPSARWFRKQQRDLPHHWLQALLAASVAALGDEIPGLGETVAFDVTHLYGWVRENNPRVYTPGPFNVSHIPAGDPDCRLGVKKSSNQVQPDGSKQEKKESLFGYGSGVASCTDPVYGDVVLAEVTQPFNENDISYFVPLYLQSVANGGQFPSNITADAAFDAWYVYQTVAPRGGIAAIALNTHGHPDSQRDRDGLPLCAKGLPMTSTFQFSHTYGYRTQRFLCPLLFPTCTGQSCDHAQFAKGRGCVKDLNWEAGGLMRVTLDRDGPLYQAIYHQRTSTERINSQSEALGLKRPKVRNGRSVANLNTLTYLLINLHALQRARAINAALLPLPWRTAA